MEKEIELAIVGVFWDGYYDIWEDFLELKERFWKDCPYPMYIVNQTKELAYDKHYDVNVLHAGFDAEYSRKVQKAIKEIKAKYYLLLLEDFFFTENLNKDVLAKTMKLIEKEGLKYYSMPMPEFTDECKGRQFKNYPNVQNIETRREYTLSCMPTIWRGDFLKESIGKGNYNAWVFEGIYAKSKDAHTEHFLSVCKVDTSNVLGLRHGALQGKLIPSIVRVLKEKGYQLKNKREQMTDRTYTAHEWKSKIKAMIPLPIQKVLKKIYRGHSVVDKYHDEIVREMTAMNLN